MSRLVIGSGMLYTSKPRSSSQPAWQRRRFTKSAATVDGEYDPDLALAIQESLKQAEVDALKLKEKQSDSVSSIQNECIRENNNTDFKSMNLTKEMCNDSNHLKDLVCAHMDLIQQQQDVINEKDKTIKSLRAENNALQCRLQRMERRLALLKQKEEMSGSPHIVTSPPPKPGTMSYTEPIFSPPEKTPHKKKVEVLLSRRQSQEATKPSPLKNVSNLSSDSSQQKHKDSHRKRKLSSVQSTSEGENNTLETNKLYFVSNCDPLTEEVEVDCGEDLLSGAQSQKEVEVPTFRIKTYSNLYVIEGTEDHEDETFVRRHQKPEIEEKRRKRWDNQRTREEMMYERLREKQEPKHKRLKPEDPIESFFPVLDDITHIEVVDMIPVTAFGQPIPFPKQESFNLPWTPKPPATTRQRR
ncbi:male-specific lethal 1-like 1 [Dreissena polymorpha]|uniref:PEHE domain-containing protein n=1 Tax=Dreissena polymorpha TaxID=45954 RepID=A0A9D4J2H7_DREPO|nr:male-specific lethal 1-like 1 [Dreissena polymorpha]KAH3795950.1 hypothetical protein DPMN_149512 [Dreissena polymorpha]